MPQSNLIMFSQNGLQYFNPEYYHPEPDAVPHNIPISFTISKGTHTTEINVELSKSAHHYIIRGNGTPFSKLQFINQIINRINEQLIKPHLNDLAKLASIRGDLITPFATSGFIRNEKGDVRVAIDECLKLIELYGNKKVGEKGEVFIRYHANHVIRWMRPQAVPCPIEIEVGMQATNIFKLNTNTLCYDAVKNGPLNPTGDLTKLFKWYNERHYFTLADYAEAYKNNSSYLNFTSFDDEGFSMDDKVSNDKLFENELNTFVDIFSKEEEVLTKLFAAELPEPSEIASNDQPRTIPNNSIGSNLSFFKNTATIDFELPFITLTQEKMTLTIHHQNYDFINDGENYAFKSFLNMKAMLLVNKLNRLPGDVIFRYAPSTKTILISVAEAEKLNQVHQALMQQPKHIPAIKIIKRGPASLSFDLSNIPTGGDALKEYLKGASTLLKKPRII